MKVTKNEEWRRQKVNQKKVHPGEPGEETVSGQDNAVPAAKEGKAGMAPGVLERGVSMVLGYGWGQGAGSPVPTEEGLWVGLSVLSLPGMQPGPS